MRRSSEEWERVVGNYRSSGQSIPGYCRLAGISVPSLRYQIKKLDGNSNQPDITAPDFVEIGRTGIKSLTGRTDRAAPCDVRQPGGFSIRLGSDAVIEVHPDTDRLTLEWALTLMMRLR